MKRLVFCFDGTWNRLDAKNPTNVVLTAESITPSVKLDNETVAQIIHYDEGVGTQTGESIRGGLFGHGLLQNLSDAYRFLIFNYTVGDEIYIFGFSRGAFTARSFVGLIRNCGILRRANASKIKEAVSLYQSRALEDHPDSEKINDFRYKYGQDLCVSEQEEQWRVQNCESYVLGDCPQFKIKYIGVWDTVESLGIPKSIPGSSWFNKKHKFHDAKLTSFVESARHAVAIDEKRNTFSPSTWDNFDVLNRSLGKEPEDFDAPYQQQWFPGGHGSVGGGGVHRGLSDQAMDWVLDGARFCGLVLDSDDKSVIYGLKPNYKEYLENYIPPQKIGSDWMVYKFMTSLPQSDRMPGPSALHEISTSVKRRWHENPHNLKDGEQYRPRTLDKVSGKLNQCDHFQVCDFSDLDYDLYIVKKGDTLSKIAKVFYGDAEKWNIIFEANTHKIDHQDRIYVGMSIFIPKNPIEQRL